ncbi:MAG: HAD hydrolase-like protein [Burkholderiaceae bacterium]
MSIFGKAARIRKVLHKTGIAAGEAIYIGDQGTDMAAARQAGVACGAVAASSRCDSMRRTKSLRRSRPSAESPPDDRQPAFVRHSRSAGSEPMSVMLGSAPADVADNRWNARPLLQKEHSSARRQAYTDSSRQVFLPICQLPLESVPSTHLMPHMI